MHIPSLRQLKRSIKIRERIDKLQSDLALIFEGMALPFVPEADKPTRKKRKMTAAGKARIAAAQKARWAKVKGGTDVGNPDVKTTAAPTKKRKMSAKGKAAIVAAQKARWAKVKGAKDVATVKKTVTPKKRKAKKG